MDANAEAGFPTEHVFVVRLWYVDRERAGAWRGYVDHVPANERVYFVDLADLIDYIRVRLGQMAGSPKT